MTLTKKDSTEIIGYETVTDYDSFYIRQGNKISAVWKKMSGHYLFESDTVETGEDATRVAYSIFNDYEDGIQFTFVPTSYSFSHLFEERHDIQVFPCKIDDIEVAFSDN